MPLAIKRLFLVLLSALLETPALLMVSVASRSGHLR